MSQENLIWFGECVLDLHENLRKYIKQSDLFEELNSLIQKIMDTTVKRKYSMGLATREGSILEKRNSARSKKVGYSFISSNAGNRVSDFKMIKPCFVKLDKICDLQSSTHLAKKLHPDIFRSNSGSLEMPRLQSIESTNNPTNDLRPDEDLCVRANINIDPEFLASEDHLDFLMAKEMESSHCQMERRFKRKVKCESTKFVKDLDLNPVVLLKRLSPQLLSKAINGKLEIYSHELNLRRKRKMKTPLQRLAVNKEVRRSKRSSVVKLGCSCCSRLSSLDPKEPTFRNKENLPRPKKRSNDKHNKSDDEEDFYGFENQTKNRHRIRKMKEALKTLSTLPSGKERHRILKVKEPLKTFRAYPLGKENGKNNLLDKDFKSFMKNKVPFKAVNRVEARSSTNEDNTFQNPTKVNGFQSCFRDDNLNSRNKKMMVLKNNGQCTNLVDDPMNLTRLEILELFKKREKLLINKMVREQGKIIVSKNGELMSEDEFLENPLNYYSGNYYIRKTGRRIPLWAEKSITNAIIESQEQIPMDIIDGYFHDNDLADPYRIATFLGNAFLEQDDDSAVKTRCL